MKNIKLLIDAELIEYFVDIQKVLSLYINDDSLLLNVGRQNSKMYLLKENITILIHHTSNILMDGTDRLFNIQSCLCNDFNKTEGSWKGKMYLYDAKPSTAPTNYRAFSAVYKLSDFQ